MFVSRLNRQFQKVLEALGFENCGYGVEWGDRDGAECPFPTIKQGALRRPFDPSGLQEGR